jgi:hypothetical protein
MKYDFDGSTNTFKAHPAYDGLPSPNATVLVPTAALFTSVYDLSHFMRMFLAGKAPDDDHGHEILKPSTLSLATKPLFTAHVNGSVDPRCNAGFSATRDGVTSSWRTCGSNHDVGVNWFPAAPGSESAFSRSGPYAQHNGGLPNFETQTALDLDPDHKMGATVLISVDRNLAGGIVGRFFAIALEKDLTATTKMADGTLPSWTNQPLAIGVARLLYVSGVKLPTELLAERTPPPIGKPGAPLPFGQHPPKPESDEVKQFKRAFLDHFTPAYRDKHGLAEGSVGSYVKELRNRIGACSTFRVRDAPMPHKVALRMRCAKGVAGDENVFDATLTVESSPPYRISALEHDKATSDDY